MSDNSFSAGGHEDLPRTVRQQKEARAREILNAPRQSYTRASGRVAPTMSNPLDDEFQGAAQSPPGQDPPAMVTQLQLPFFHLMGFFLKAVFAGIPALIIAVTLMMGIFWAVGQIVEHYAPWLVKMRIVISFPG